MKNIKVLGSGCNKCKKTAELIEATARKLGIAAQISKVKDAQTIMDYGVMSTPAVVVDEQLVHSGSVPNSNEIEQWIK